MRAYTRIRARGAPRRSASGTIPLVSATEDGIIEHEDWDDVVPGIGHVPVSPLGQLQINRRTGEVRRKEGYESLVISDPRPERPA